MALEDDGRSRRSARRVELMGPSSGRGSRCVVVVTDRPLVPPWTGNRVRIWGLIRCLQKLGCRVAIVGSNLGNSNHLECDVKDVFPVAAPPFSGGELRQFNIVPYRRALHRAVAALDADVVIAEYGWM